MLASEENTGLVVFQRKRLEIHFVGMHETHGRFMEWDKSKNLLAFIINTWSPSSSICLLDGTWSTMQLYWITKSLWNKTLWYKLEFPWEEDMSLCGGDWFLPLVLCSCQSLAVSWSVSGTAENSVLMKVCWAFFGFLVFIGSCGRFLYCLPRERERKLAVAGIPVAFAKRVEAL